MISITCQAILFDLDGTLVDSAARIYRLWQAWSQRHNISIDALLSVMPGRRAIETIQLVAPHLHAEREAMALEHEEIADIQSVQAYPGVQELLRGLPSNRWAIVTSGSRRIAEARIKHVKLPMPTMFITADDVKKGKPAPEGYLLAAHGLQVRPRDCVVIEDSPAGIKAGKLAEMQVIGITTTHTERELQEADIIVSEVAGISFTLERTGLILRSKF